MLNGKKTDRILGKNIICMYEDQKICLQSFNNAEVEEDAMMRRWNRNQREVEALLERKNSVSSEEYAK